MKLSDKIVNNEITFCSMAEKRRMIRWLEERLKVVKDDEVSKKALEILNAGVRELE